MAKIKGKWEWNDIITDSPRDIIGRGFSFTSNNEPFIGLRILVIAGGGVDIAYLYDEDNQGVYYMSDTDSVNNNYRTIDFGSTRQEIDDDLYDFITNHATCRDPKTIKGRWRWNDIIPSTDSIDIMSGCAVSFTSNNKKYDRIAIDTNFRFDNGDFVGTVWALFYGYDEVCASEMESTSIPVGSAYREMDFGSTAQEISYELYLYLLENATYQMPQIADKLKEIAENEERVYNAGYEKGNTEGYEDGHTIGYEEGKAKGIEEGKQSEYDLFWDNFQKNGARRYYARAFADTTSGGRMWMYGKTYRPKYPIKPVDAMQMYEYGYLPYEAIAAVDFSECTDFYLTFAYFDISGRKFPPIDISSATRTQNMFGWNTSVHEIEEIKVSENTALSGMFNGTTNLQEVRFNGTIGQNGLNFQSCTQLSKASIYSVAEHLSNTTTGLTVTFSKAAVDKAFETAEGRNDGSYNNAEWDLNILHAHSNWTISLV